jgi:VIT family protein
MHAETSAPGKSLLQAIGKSFYDSIGDIVFGMEDGTVSIFGLVFGVASSTTSSSVVLLAGATGAISAAVSMMAGTFLDVESTNDQAKAQLAQEQREIENNLEGEKQEVRDRLRTAGFNDQDTATIVDALAQHPKTLRHRSRQPLNSISGVRNRRIRSSSLHGCSSPTCLPHLFPSYHSHYSPWHQRASSRSSSRLRSCCCLV